MLDQVSLPPPPLDEFVTRLATTAEVAVAKESVSLPPPPSIVSSPSPASMMSSPSPALMESDPGPPVMVLALASPTTTCPPLRKTMFSKPEMVSLPSPVTVPVRKSMWIGFEVVKTTVSTPSPPMRVSSPAPP